jgi:beta-glucosidase
MTQDIRASIDALVDSLTLDEQVSLLAGIDFWHTAPIERLGIPSMRVSDGPAGARGTDFSGPASINVPCSTSLAATWDPVLVEEVGRLLGRETRVKGARVLLAPTVNIHRTPIGGRNFECMSEDPYLTARTAVAYIKGLQSQGVASCIKHFVGNDTEFERNSIDSQIDERTLRELYLVPFEAAVAEANVMAVMTAYNRVNGPFAADHKALIDDVLRGEWGFDGLVMSDWFGLHSTVEGLEAGLDLEMPGPTLHRGQQVIEAVERGDLDAAHVRAAARNVIALLTRLGVLADGAPPPDRASEGADSERAIVRRAGSAGMVLLRNESAALPLASAGLGQVAIIGPNASDGQIMGGGSAHVTPTHRVTPLAALTERLEAAGSQVVFAPGCVTNKRLPQYSAPHCDGLQISYFDEPDDVDRPGAVSQREQHASTSHLMWPNDPIDPSRRARFGAVARTTFTPDVDGEWQFSLTSVGDVRLFVNGELCLDNTGVARGGSFFGMGKNEVREVVAMEAGCPYEIEARLIRNLSGDSLAGMHLGAIAPEPVDLMDRAIDLAATSEMSIVVVGTNADWESEGWDRDELNLPGRQDELISRVAQVSKRTIVVVNAGSPVSMPWLDSVDAVLMVWFPGQEMGDSLCDVLFGEVEPGGRLPVTFPRSLEDTPAFEHHPGRNGEAKYLERRLIGYRWYDTVGREPLFPFGFGLGYTTFEIANAETVAKHTVAVDVRNIGSRAGSEIVQVYAHRVDRPAAEADEPEQRLAGSAKVTLDAGSSTRVTIELDPRSYQTWDVARHAWVEPAGTWDLRIGRSSRDIAATCRVEAGALSS